MKKLRKIAVALSVCLLMVSQVCTSVFAEEGNADISSSVNQDQTPDETEAPGGETENPGQTDGATDPETPADTDPETPAVTDPATGNETDPGEDSKNRGEVVAIEISVQPKTNYVTGDKLNLSPMKVKLTYESGETVEIGYADFAKNGISVRMSNSVECSNDAVVTPKYYNTGRVIVSYGDLSASSVRLSVKETAGGTTTGVCDHSNTKTDRKNPTCVEAGYEKIVCADCEKEISSTELPIDENAHNFGEWTVTVEPTETSTGTRTRTCSLCNHTETEDIPAVTTDSPGNTTTAPSTTVPKETDPADETGKTPNGNGSNSGKLNGVLIGLIVFLAVAIVAVIIAIIKVKSGSSEGSEYDYADDDDEYDDDDDDDYDEYEDDDDENHT